MMKEDLNLVVNLENVTKVFGVNGRETRAVNGISLQAHKGEMVLLLGPSGSGKTTLLTLMAGLQRPTSGTVQLFGRKVVDYTSHELQRLRAVRIGFIFQNFHLIDSLTVLENVMLVTKFAGTARNEARRRAFDLLEKFGIKHLAGASPRKISQGEKQRVAVVRALVNGAELILADEPTANLESKQGLEIINFLHSNIKNDNSSVVIASHDERIMNYADRVLRLEDGLLANF
jgi:ABC-type lipoprotein export system ATPase subunit